MSTHTRLSVTALALLSGLSLAAAGTSAIAASSQDKMAKPSSISQPMDKLSLTSAQRKSAWEDISQLAAKQKAPKGFTAKVGKALPSTVATNPVPVSTANDVPKLRPYHYALLNNKLLIVNPKDKKVVEIITR